MVPIAWNSIYRITGNDLAGVLIVEFLVAERIVLAAIDRLHLYSKTRFRFAAGVGNLPDDFVLQLLGKHNHPMSRNVLVFQLRGGKCFIQLLYLFRIAAVSDTLLSIGNVFLCLVI